MRGYRETEHLGIFHLDTRNRWTPGDLDNRSDWKPRVETRLTIVDGNADGVTYESSTGILSYDGSGQGTRTARVRLEAPSEAANSQVFSVRVLEPTVVWGEGAERRFARIGQDSARITWKQMQRGLRVDAPYDVAQRAHGDRGNVLGGLLPATRAAQPLRNRRTRQPAGARARQPESRRPRDRVPQEPRAATIRRSTRAATWETATSICTSRRFISTTRPAIPTGSRRRPARRSRAAAGATGSGTSTARRWAGRATFDTRCTSRGGLIPGC